MSQNSVTEPSYIHALVGTFSFENLGQGKVSKTAKLRGEDDLWKAIQPHFMSRDLGYDYDAETKVGKVYAGGRHVGDFRRTGE